MENLTHIGLLFGFIFTISAASKLLKIPHIFSLILGGIIGKFLFPPEMMDQLRVLEIIALVLLLFFIGLDFSPERLTKTMRINLIPGIFDLVLNFSAVFLASYLLTKDISFSFVISSALYPTSTAITVKLIENYKRTPYMETDVVLGILIIEDIACVLLISLLSQSGQKLQPTTVMTGLLLIPLFIALFFLLRKPAEKLLTKLSSVVNEEVIAFLILGIVLIPSEVLRKFNISEILIAFLVGCLIPERSEIYSSIQRNLYGLKEFSAGLFFFLFAFDAKLSFRSQDILIMVILSVVSIVSKMVSIYIGTLVATRSRSVSLRASLSMIQRGEFSLIMGGFNPMAKAVSPVAVMITSFVGIFSFAWAPTVTRYILTKLGRKKRTKVPIDPHIQQPSRT